MLPTTPTTLPTPTGETTGEPGDRDCDGAGGGGGGGDTGTCASPRVARFVQAHRLLRTMTTATRAEARWLDYLAQRTPGALTSPELTVRRRQRERTEATLIQLMEQAGLLVPVTPPRGGWSAAPPAPKKA